jgi:hypothetical protein
MGRDPAPAHCRGPCHPGRLFTTIPRHTVSVTAAGKEPIALLVVPPATVEGIARTAMNMAATSRGSVQAADILTASEPGAVVQLDLGAATD